MIARDAHGLGLGLRTPFVAELLDSERTVDFLEIVPENYVRRGGLAVRLLERCAERWPILAHGVGANLGGPDPLDEAYLADLRGLLDALNIPIYTDHLCFSRIHGFQTHGLLPVPQTSEAIEHCASRIRRVRDLLDRPVAIENIAQYATMPGSEMSREAFITAVCDTADCGLLLDVNNVVVNARNGGSDPHHDLRALPLGRTVQIHIAGHETRGERCLDSHGSPVSEAVIALTIEALGLLEDPVPVLLERDLNIPPLSELLDEADHLRVKLFGEGACS